MEHECFTDKRIGAKDRNTRREPTWRTLKRKGFLEYIDLESESISQDNAEGASDDSESATDEIEVGRKVTPRKKLTKTPCRSPKKKCKIETKQVCKETRVEHDSDLDNEMNVDNNDVNRGLDRPEIVWKENSDADPDELLEQMGNESLDIENDENKHSEEFKNKVRPRTNEKNSHNMDSVGESIDDIFNRKTAVRKKNNDSTGETRKDGEGDGTKAKKVSVDLSILDDLFFSSRSAERSKPTPSKADKTKASKTKDVETERSAIGVVGIKRGDSTGSSADEAVHLETSTLRDDILDCFDNPSPWGSRKRKSAKKSQVNQKEDMTVDSDSDVDKPKQKVRKNTKPVREITIDGDSESDKWNKNVQKKTKNVSKMKTDGKRSEGGKQKTHRDMKAVREVVVDSGSDSDDWFRGDDAQKNRDSKSCIKNRRRSSVKSLDGSLSLFD